MTNNHIISSRHQLKHHICHLFAKSRTRLYYVLIWKEVDVKGHNVPNLSHEYRPIWRYNACTIHTRSVASRTNRSYCLHTVNMTIDLTHFYMGTFSIVLIWRKKKKSDHSVKSRNDFNDIIESWIVNNRGYGIHISMLKRHMDADVASITLYKYGKFRVHAIILD